MQIVLPPNPFRPEAVQVTWKGMGAQKDAILSYPYFKTNPYYKALIDAAFMVSPPFEQRNKVGQKKFAADVSFAAMKAQGYYEQNEAVVRDASKVLIAQLEAMAAESFVQQEEGCCCVIA